MKKIIVLIFIILMLTGCSEVRQKDNVEFIDSEQLEDYNKYYIVSFKNEDNKVIRLTASQTTKNLLVSGTVYDIKYSTTTSPKYFILDIYTKDKDKDD